MLLLLCQRSLGVKSNHDFGVYAHKFLLNIPTNFSMTYIVNPGQGKTPVLGLTRTVKIIKYGNSYRLDTYLHKSDKKKLAWSVCYDGDSFYAFSDHNKILKVGSNVRSFTADIVNVMSRSPLSSLAFINYRGGREFDQGADKFKITVPVSINEKVSHLVLERSKLTTTIAQLKVSNTFWFKQYAVIENADPIYYESAAYSLTLKELKLLKDKKDVNFFIASGDARIIYDSDLRKLIRRKR